jgi:hypothetical protein
MFRNIWAVAGLVLFLGGCATASSYSEPNRQLMASLPYSYANFDAVLAWDVKDTGSGLVIDGLLRNRRYVYMEGAEVWVALRNPAGKTVARSVAFIIPRQLYQDEIAPFTVRLPVSAEPGSKLHFTYKYRGSDGGGGDHGGGVDYGPWLQTFEVKVPGL